MKPATKKAPLIFNYANLGSQDAATVQLKKAFFNSGGETVKIAMTEFKKQAQRGHGVTYKEIFITFTDTQTVAIRVKPTGDIFQVTLNDKVLPLRNQDDHEAAVTEIIQALNAGRTRWQKLLTRQKITLSPSISTPRVSQEKKLTEVVDSLKAQVSDVDNAIAEMQNLIDAKNTGLSPHHSDYSMPLPRKSSGFFGAKNFNIDYENVPQSLKELRNRAISSGASIDDKKAFNEELKKYPGHREGDGLVIE